MRQSESPMKTTPSTTKRFHLNVLVNQVMKFFASSNHSREENSKPKNGIHLLIIHILYIISFSFLQYLAYVLPSISVTSPEGQTTAVE